MDSRVVWLWLQEAFGPGSPLPCQIAEAFPGGAVGFCRAGPSGWRKMPGLTGRHLQALPAFTPEDAQNRLAQALRLGWQVVTPSCPNYPEALRNLYNPPAALYGLGHWPDFSAAPAVGLVGARKALSHSREAARRIGGELAKGGALVVSGAAGGVDCAALSGALEARGQTVSVLPVSLDSPYPMETAWLRRKILNQGGALVTEYFHAPKPVPGAFRQRNRLITGLSFGVVLVQAGIRSGTMLYAGCAAAQDREGYVYPGPPEAPEYSGSRLLLEEGAAPIESGANVLQDCPPYYWGRS